jgi:hypothetical protein
MACFQKNTHRYLSLGIVDIEYGTVPVNWFPARLLQKNKLLRQYAIKQTKNVSTFKRLTVFQASYLEDCMESADHYQGYFGSCHCIEFGLRQFPQIEQREKKRHETKLTAQSVTPWCSYCKPMSRRVPSLAIYYGKP